MKAPCSICKVDFDPYDRSPEEDRLFEETGKNQCCGSMTDILPKLYREYFGREYSYQLICFKCDNILLKQHVLDAHTPVDVI